MKNRVTKCLVMGTLAIGITSNAMAAEDEQLCFQINGDINNSTQIDKIYLTVNSVGVATGNGCFYSISDKRATPRCGPLLGNVNGIYPEAFLSLQGNWQATVGQDVISEDTNVSVHYNFKKLSGEGIAKTLKTNGNAPAQEVNSSEGSVSRIACPKPVFKLINHFPKLSLTTPNTTPLPLAVSYPITATATSCPNLKMVTNCQTYSNEPTGLSCQSYYQLDMVSGAPYKCDYDTKPTSYPRAQACIQSNTAC